jgi:hypothetical protein
MARQKIEIVQDSGKSVAQLFAILSDHNRLREVFGIPVKRIRDGKSDLNGLGSVRRIGFPGPLGVEETVTGLHPDRSIDYRISKGGGPVRNHAGRMVFETMPGGSRVIWTIEFDALPLLGTAIRLVLTTAIKGGLKRIA